jgi:hypothetical protein
MAREIERVLAQIAEQVILPLNPALVRTGVEGAIRRACVAPRQAMELEMTAKKLPASQRISRRSNNTGVRARVIVEMSTTLERNAL